MKISERIFRANYAIRDNAVLAEVEKLKKSGRTIFELNIGDPGGMEGAYGFAVPKHIVAAYVAALKSGKNEGYATSQGDIFLRKTIQKDALSRGIRDVNVENIVTGQGVSEIIDFLFASLLDKGKNVVLPRPDYPLYTALAGYYEGDVRYYDLDPENNWEPRPEQIAGLIDENTIAVILINPNNPTGTAYDAPLLKRIISAVSKAGGNCVPIISDEIYRELRFSGKHVPLASLSTTLPIITFDGLSKNHYAPGYRLGCAIFSNFCKKDCACLMDAVTKLGGFRLSANKPAQHAFRAALEDRAKNAAIYARHLKQLKARTKYAYSRLKKIPGISVDEPKGAFYILPKASGPWKNDKEFQLALLREAGVLVVPGSGFAMDPKGLYFRVVTLPPVPAQKKAYDALEEFMKKHLGK